MKPSPSDRVRITENVWEITGAGSYQVCNLLKGCIAGVLSWEEYYTYANRFPHEDKDLLELRAFMDRRGRWLPVIVVEVPADLEDIDMPGADFTDRGEVGGIAVLKEGEFEIIDQKSESDVETTS
jgi:hypothetical protein